MLCCICKEKEATVHLTQIAGDKMQKVDLCEECAKTKGVNDPTGFSLADLLLGLGASQEIEQAAGGADLKCPRCGFTQADFKKAGRLGCPECYKTFAERAGGLAQDDAQRHAARRQGARSAAPDPRSVRPAQDACRRNWPRPSRRRISRRPPSCATKSSKPRPALTSADGNLTDHGPPRISHPAGRDRAPQRAARPDRDVQPRPAGAQSQGRRLSRLGQEAGARARPGD